MKRHAPLSSSPPMSAALRSTSARTSSPSVRVSSRVASRTVHGIVSGSGRREEPNSAPSQWARRLARAVGERFDVEMVTNHARNVGTWRGRDVVIKCAKSTAPPVSVLVSMLDRLDEVWAVFVLPSGAAEVWRVSIPHLRRHGHFTRAGRDPMKTPSRVEIRRRKVVRTGTLLGHLEASEVEACRIP